MHPYLLYAFKHLAYTFISTLNPLCIITYVYVYIYIHNSIYIYIYVCVHHMGLCENVVPQYMAISIATIMINYNQTCINPIFMFIVDSIYIYQYDMHMSKIICISITDVHPKYHANP